MTKPTPLHAIMIPCVTVTPSRSLVWLSRHHDPLRAIPCVTVTHHDPLCDCHASRSLVWLSRITIPCVTVTHHDPLCDCHAITIPCVTVTHHDPLCDCHASRFLVWLSRITIPCVTVTPSQSHPLCDCHASRSLVWLSRITIPCVTVTHHDPLCDCQAITIPCVTVTHHDPLCDCHASRSLVWLSRITIPCVTVRPSRSLVWLSRHHDPLCDCHAITIPCVTVTPSRSLVWLSRHLKSLEIDNLQNYCLRTRYGARSRSRLCRRPSISLVRYRHGLEKFLEHHFIPIRRRFNPHDLPADLLRVQDPFFRGRRTIFSTGNDGAWPAMGTPSMALHVLFLCGRSSLI